MLEVILALVLFVGAAAVLAVAFNSSMEGVERQKRQQHAADLALTVLSEIQLGIRSAGPSGPEPFKLPFQNWTWQIATSSVEEEPGESSGLTHVEVTIRHTESSLVYRIHQTLPLDKIRLAKPAQEGGNS